MQLENYEKEMNERKMHTQWETKLRRREKKTRQTNWDDRHESRSNHVFNQYILQSFNGFGQIIRIRVRFNCLSCWREQQTTTKRAHISTCFHNLYAVESFRYVHRQLQNTILTTREQISFIFILFYFMTPYFFRGSFFCCSSTFYIEWIPVSEEIIFWIETSATTTRTNLKRTSWNENLVYCVDVQKWKNEANEPNLFQ